MLIMYTDNGRPVVVVPVNDDLPLEDVASISVPSGVPWSLISRVDADAIMDELEAAANSPVNTRPQVIACALRVTVSAAVVAAVAGSYRVAAIQYLDTGTFLAIFAQDLGPEPFLLPNNGISVSIAEWGGDWAVLEVRDHAGGTLIDPAGFGFTLHSF